MTIIKVNKEFKWDRKGKELLKITVWNKSAGLQFELCLGTILVTQKVLV